MTEDPNSHQAPDHAKNESTPQSSEEDPAVQSEAQESTALQDQPVARFLPRDGGVLQGNLYLQTPANERSNRIILEAWERSNLSNNRAGDVLELHWRTPFAKPFIGWWDSTDPEKPQMKAWIGAHDWQNNPEPDAQPHRHWSIEVSDETTGGMQTRLSIPFDKDHTNIKTSSADFTVGWGTLRLAQGSLEFSQRADADPTDRRWSVKPTDQPDFDLQVRRHDDDGTSETIARLDRATGFVGLGGNHRPERVLHIRHASSALLVEGTADTKRSLALFKHSAIDSRVIQTKVEGDEVSRFSLQASGSMAWGNGADNRDIKFRPYFEGKEVREARIYGADVRVMDKGRGLVLTDSENDVAYRLRISDGQIEVLPL